MGKYRLFYTVFYILTIQFLTSCSSERHILFGDNFSNKTTDSAVYEVQKGKTAYNIAEQKIQPGDELTLNNLQNESLISGTTANNASGASNTSYLVETDSTAFLPILGKVKLGGLTRENAERLVNDLYQKSLLKNPLINLTISNLHVSVLGEFTQQGILPLKKEKTHLNEILAIAGGLNRNADLKAIKILRGDPENPQILLVNLNDKNYMADKRVFLQKNDIIYAATKKSVQNAEKQGKIASFVGIGLTLINTIFLIYNISR